MDRARIVGGVFEIGDEFDDVARKAVIGLHVPAKGAGGRHVAARCPSETEIDTVRIERRERSELFGNDEGRMVRQHDAARADADRARLRGDEAEGDGGRRARDPRHIVMFGHPEAMIAETFGMNREIGRAGERRRGVGALGNGRQVEDGGGDHQWGSPR